MHQRMWSKDDARRGTVLQPAMWNDGHGVLHIEPHADIALTTDDVGDRRDRRGNIDDADGSDWGAGGFAAALSFALWFVIVVLVSVDLIILFGWIGVALTLIGFYLFMRVIARVARRAGRW